MARSLIMGSAASNLVDAGIGGSDNPKTSVSKSFAEDSQRIRTRVLVDLVFLLSNVDWKRFASEIVHQLDLPAQAVMRWFWDQAQSVPAETSSVTGIGKKATSTRCQDSLPNDLQSDVLQSKVDFLDRFILKAVSSGSPKFIGSDVLRRSRGGVSEGTFAAISYYIKNNSSGCSSYDLHSKSWRSLPPLSYLPPPDAELFKEYSVCSHGGLMCAEVSKLPKKGELVVFNPLTGETRALPPLLHPRNPVLVHLSVDSAKKSYKVIVAGSSDASDEHLSRKVEVFDSSTSKWKEACDLPGPAFTLNEHQAGVCLNGELFFIAIQEGGGRGVVALDVENGTWLPDLTAPIPWSSSSDTLHLVESDGKLFLFSEKETDQSVDHCIHEFEFPDPEAGVQADDCIDELGYQNPKKGVSTRRWRSFVKVKKSGGRGLEVHPDYTCVDFRGEKQGIFSHLSWRKLNILLASCLAIMMPNGACAGDLSIDSPSSMWNPSNTWNTYDFANLKKAACTLAVLIGAGVVWGILRRRQAPGHRFDIMPGLERSDPPRRGDPLREIFPAIPA